MRTKTLLMFVVFAGVAAGALGVTTLNAQSPSATNQPAFYISEFEVTDPDALRAYSARVIPSP
jgi:hypothetical protein